MPYEIQQGAGCPASSPFAVVKIGSGQVMGCHKSRDDAMSQMAALHANEAMAAPANRWFLSSEHGEWMIHDGDGNEVASFVSQADAIDHFSGLYAALAGDPAMQKGLMGTPFTAFVVPEGIESSDMRMLEPNTTTWRTPPMPLMVQDTASHGDGDPGPAWFAGAFTEMYRDPNNPLRIMGRGHLLMNADGQRAETLIRGGLRGVSIDGYGLLPPVRQDAVVDQYGQPLIMLTRYTDTVVMGATVVPHQAFPQASIWFDDEEPPSAELAPGIAVDAAPTVMEVDRPDPLAILIASGGGPLRPPRAWFDVPEADGHQPLRWTEDGQITGHVARDGICHLGYQQCEMTPKSKTNYAYFHVHAVTTAEGDEIPCGVITLGTNHVRDVYASAEETLDHMEKTGLAVAKVRLTDGKYGVWACGAVKPGLSEDVLWQLDGATTSGEWREVRDGGRRYPRELIALLCVNQPGFPIPRAEVLVASAGNEIIASESAGEPIEFVTRDGEVSDVPCIPCEASKDEQIALLVEENRRLRLEGARGQIPGKAEAFAAIAQFAPNLAAVASGSTSLPLADRETPWDAASAQASVWAWAKDGDSWDWGKAAQAFFWHAPNPQAKGDFKLPFARVVGGRLQAVPRGIFAVAQRLGQTDIPAADVSGVKAKVTAYYRRISTPDNPAEVPFGGPPNRGTSKDKRLKRNHPAAAVAEDNVVGLASS